MKLIKAEVPATFKPTQWDLTSAAPAPPSRPDQIDIVFIDLGSGAIDMADAEQRVREIVGALEVASTNAAMERWSGDKDPDDDGLRLLT